MNDFNSIRKLLENSEFNYEINFHIRVISLWGRYVMYAIVNKYNLNYFVFDDVKNTCIACSLHEYNERYANKVCNNINDYYDVEPNLKLYMLLRDSKVIVKDIPWLSGVATYSIYTEIRYKNQFSILSWVTIYFSYCNPNFFDSICLTKSSLNKLNWLAEDYIEKGSDYFNATFLCPMEYIVYLLNSEELVKDLLRKSYFKFNGKSYNLLSENLL